MARQRPPRPSHSAPDPESDPPVGESDLDGSEDPAEESGDAAPPETPGRGFPIVAIGASAGGLAALEAFFSSFVETGASGFAFVVLQHLSPRHRSAMRELLQRHTSLAVSYVSDGTRIEPDHVYIVPAGNDAEILNGTFHLLEPILTGPVHLPIDSFFGSLARDLRERSIGVVLSGSGSDGTAGLRAVKAEGGLVVAQEPGTAEYEGMPRSAIATGLVDLVLPPREIPAKLVAYVQHTFRSPGETTVPGRLRSPEFIKKVCVVLRRHTGHDFSQYKVSTFSRRIERRMAIHQLDRPEDYFQYLRRNPVEAEALFRDLLIGVTSFFRDPAAFDALGEQVLPRVFDGRPANSLVRIWVPGCSSGEEAYSIAILVREHLDRTKDGHKVQIFGSDVDRRAIERARAGTYPESIASDVSTERLQRYFNYDGGAGTYRVMKTVRDMLIFAEQDVIRDPPFSRLDLLSCRNLLIYLNPELQRRLLPLFHYALNPGGYLFLGSSESVGDLSALFDVVDRKAKIFVRRLEGAMRAPTPLADFWRPARPSERPAAWGARRANEEGRDALRDLTERTLLKHVTQPAVLVNSRGDVLHVHGRTGQFLEPAPGDSGMNVLTMAREGLRRDLTLALHRAGAEAKPVTVPSVRVRTNGDFIQAKLSILPVGSEGDARPNPDLFLVVFEAIGPAVEGPEGSAADAPAESSRPLDELERELRAKDEYVQTILEEMETTNEELKSSNEEMQSVNEELQSTNEELETSKEELQSVNEELATINNELQAKVTELSQTNNDMNNLLAGNGVATLFLDLELRIARFTPTTAELINVIQTDVGRPVGHVVTNLVNYDRLIEDLQGVLESLEPRELEVQTRTGAWFLMRLRPYRTLQNVIEGLVVTFVDITERRRAEEQVRAQLVEITSYYENAPVAFAVLDRHLRFVRVNPTFAEMNRLPIAAHIGKLPADVMPALGEPETRRRIDEMVASGRPLTRLEVREEPSRPPAIQRAWVQGWYPLRDTRGGIAGYTVIVQEVTEREHLAGLVRAGDASLDAQIVAFQRLLEIGARPEPGDLRTTLEQLLDVAIDVTAADMGDIRLLGPNGELEVMASRGFDREWIESANRVPASGPWAEALQRRERIVIEDVTESSLFPEAAALEIQLKAAARGVQSTPIIGRDGRAIGTFSTYFRTPRRSDDRALRLLDILARQTADFIERSNRDTSEGSPR